MVITQNGQRAIIQWQGFSIGLGETVQFIQPGALSAILNRVVGSDPSVILGALRANGQVFLVNPNGVFFGKSARVDVGGLVVSTLNLGDGDFLAGNYVFTQHDSKQLASIVNQGTLKVKDNGLLILASPLISNEGLVIAQQGRVVLAAGEQATVSFDGHQLVHFQVQGSTTGNDSVLLPHDAAREVLQGVVSESGVQQADRLVLVDGQWELSGGSGTLINHGEIRVDGRPGKNAGSIALDSTATTHLTAGSRLSATGRGPGSSAGKILVLSEGLAEARPGSVAAIGAENGDGGFVELSGARIVNGLELEAEVSGGKRGRFLIDPPSITVADGPVPAVPAMDTVYEESLESSAVDVAILADDEVFIEDISDDEIMLPADIDLSIETTNPDGQGIIFEEEDFFITSGSGSVSVSSASDILGFGGFESETSVTLSAGGEIGEIDEAIFVRAPLVSATAGDDLSLDTDADFLSIPSAGRVSILEVDDVEVDIVADDKVGLTAFGDISGTITAKESSVVTSIEGVVGTESSPLVVDIDGELLVRAGDEIEGVSVVLSGTVSDEALVVDSTPGDATLNGDELEAVSAAEILFFTEDDDEFADLFFELGFDDEDIDELEEELEEQLGLLFDEIEFDEEGPEGELEADREPKPSQQKPPPLVAQAGLGLENLDTRVLLDLNIEQFQTLQVLMTRPSPFDLAIEAPNLQANDILDLETFELSEVGVTLTYDVTGDPIIMNPNLRALDIMGLDPGELGEVPIRIP